MRRCCAEVVSSFSSCLRRAERSKFAHGRINYATRGHSPADLRLYALQKSIYHRMGIDIPGDGTSVPPDFVVAQRAKLVNIQEIARKAGLQDAEVDLYGTSKAKVWFTNTLVGCSRWRRLSLQARPLLCAGSPLICEHAACAVRPEVCSRAVTERLERVAGQARRQKASEGCARRQVWCAPRLRHLPVS